MCWVQAVILWHWYHRILSHWLWTHGWGSLHHGNCHLAEWVHLVWYPGTVKTMSTKVKTKVSKHNKSAIPCFAKLTRNGLFAIFLSLYVIVSQSMIFYITNYKLFKCLQIVTKLTQNGGFPILMFQEDLLLASLCY